MSLPAPIRISDQANIIQTVLNAYAASYGGIASVCSNLRDMWNQASMDSTRPRMLIVWNGAESRGSFEVRNANSREDREWLVAVTRGRGFFANRGDSLSKPMANEKPFYDVVEDVRDLCRVILNISEELPAIDYKTIRPMQLGNLVVDGYIIAFGTANDIPQILSSPPDNVSLTGM